MRLADFILQDMEPILAHWEAFAATLLPAAENMGALGSVRLTRLWRKIGQ